MPSDLRFTHYFDSKTKNYMPIVSTDRESLYGDNLNAQLLTSISSYLPLNPRTFYGTATINASVKKHFRPPFHPLWLTLPDNKQSVITMSPNPEAFTACNMMIAPIGEHMAVWPCHLLNNIDVEIKNLRFLSSTNMPLMSLQGLEYSHLTSLCLEYISLTRDTLAILASIQSLIALDLTGTNLQDLTILIALQALQWLDISDSFVRTIPPFPNLIALKAELGALTHIPTMPKLQYFHASKIAASLENLDILSMKTIILKNHFITIDRMFFDHVTIAQNARAAQTLFPPHHPMYHAAGSLMMRAASVRVTRATPPTCQVLHLNLSGSNVSLLTGADLARLFPSLQELYLNSEDRSEFSLKTVDGLSHLTNLLRLDLSAMQFADTNPAPLAIIGELLNLEELMLKNCSSLISLAGLQKLQKLRRLAVTNAKITDTSPISELRNLTEFDGSGNPITNMVLPPNLYILELSNLPEYNFSLATSIPSLKFLVSLVLDNNPTRNYKRNPNFTWLINLLTPADNTPPHPLVQLSIKGTPISQSQFFGLLALIPTSKITDFQAGACPKIKNLSPQQFNIPRCTPPLEQLSLSELPIQSRCLHSVILLFTALKSLNISNCRNIDDFSILMTLKSIEQLIIAGTSINDDQLDEFLLEHNTSVEKSKKDAWHYKPSLKLLDIRNCHNIHTPYTALSFFAQATRKQCNARFTILIEQTKDAFPPARSTSTNDYNIRFSFAAKPTVKLTPTASLVMPSFDDISNAVAVSVTAATSS